MRRDLQAVTCTFEREIVSALGDQRSGYEDGYGYGMGLAYERPDGSGEGGMIFSVPMLSEYVSGEGEYTI